MATRCDNKSVGVIIRDGERMLLIKRKNYPRAYACVAGHMDGDSPLEAAMKETREEAGLSFPPERFTERITSLKLENPCKRSGGVSHEWFVYEVHAPGAMPQAGSDAKEVLWVVPSELVDLIAKTDDAAKRNGVHIEDLSRSTPVINADTLWNENPGLEPVWIVLFRALQM